MNYLDQWTFVPELPKDKPEIQFYRYALLDPMTEGTVGAAVSTVYYKKEAVEALKDNLAFGTDYSVQNSLAKPSLPYYPLSV